MLRGEAGTWTGSQIPSSAQGCCSQLWLGADEGARAAPTVATGLVPAPADLWRWWVVHSPPLRLPLQPLSSEAKITAWYSGFSSFPLTKHLALPSFPSQWSLSLCFFTLVKSIKTYLQFHLQMLLPQRQSCVYILAVVLRWLRLKTTVQ